MREAGESIEDNIASLSSSSSPSSSSPEEYLSAGDLYFWSQLGKRGLRDVLPPWLGGHPPLNTTTQSLARMLRSLKTATESYLVDAGFVTGISTANIILPFQLQLNSTYRDAIRAAATSVSLKAPLAGGPSAGYFAAMAHGIEHLCDLDRYTEEGDEATQEFYYPPAQLVLTVDYNQAALTAILFIEDCGYYEEQQVLHDVSLGARELSHYCSVVGEHECRSGLRSALHQLIWETKLNSDEPTPLQTGELVFHGEATADHRLNDVLKEVLLEQRDRQPVFTAKSYGSLDHLDPLFAASQYLAHDCWKRISGLY